MDDFFGGVGRAHGQLQGQGDLLGGHPGRIEGSGEVRQCGEKTCESRVIVAKPVGVGATVGANSLIRFPTYHCHVQ